jgi:hypothetical protein
MTSTPPGRNASDLRRRAKLKRYTEFGGAACVGACAVAAVLWSAAIFTLDFPVASQTVAAWAQAVVSTAAIAIALYGVWYQAERAHRIAADASKAQESERLRQHIDEQRRELRAAHAALAACSVWLSASMHVKEEKDEDKKMKLRTDHLSQITERLRKFETPELASDINAAMTTVVGVLDALAGVFREMAEGLHSTAPAIRYSASAALLVRHIACDIEKKILILEKDARARKIAGNFSIVQPVRDWRYARGWDAVFNEHNIELSDIIGPAWASAFDE